MKKMLSSLALITLFATGCASNSSMAEPNTAGTAGGALGAQKSIEPTHYRLLSDPKSIRQIDWSQPPLSLHVKGYLTNRGFVPTSQVEGKGKVCENGQDWVDLDGGAVHRATEGVAPKSPYISGCVTKLGAFVPSTRQVNYAQ